MKIDPSGAGRQSASTASTPLRTRKGPRRTRRQCSEWKGDAIQSDRYTPPAEPDIDLTTHPQIDAAKVAAVTAALREGRLPVNAEVIADCMIARALNRLRKYS